jgi:outer membrane receptor for ferrienterochelin and colicins
MSKLIPFACAAMIGSAACAQQPPEQTPSTPVSADKPAAAPAAKVGPDGKLQQVTVSGSRANDTEVRRNATAAKMVFGREELDRNGDSNVGEILKRLPGVTMGGAPGRGGGGVRMRGLGNGYTQMLVNGERPPAGFSLETLSPDQVERIEIMRGPVAEHSTQAIAGTINIVLREGYVQKDIQLRVADNIEQGRHGPNLSVTMPGKSGSLSWVMNGSMFASHQHDQTDTINEDLNLAGVPVKQQLLDDQSDRRSKGVHLTPRLSYRFDNGDTLTFQPFMVYNRTVSGSTGTLDQRIGALAPEYASANGESEATAAFMRGFGNWVHKIDGGAKIDVKFGFGGGHTRSEGKRFQYNASGALSDRFDDSEVSNNHGLSTGGKYTTPMGKGHLLAAGWDIEAMHRSQTSAALMNGLPQFAASGDSLTADTRRVAGFVQDEWDITPQWSAYFGLRWEGIRTSSTVAGAGVRNTSSVWSPVLHSVWRIPGREKDQIRASLTQSYKAPGINDLIAVPAFSRINSAVRPDRIGNPNLKPELAKGIDLAYEHYIGKSGILSASGFVRNIDDLIRREVVLRPGFDGPRWVSTPTNIGKARTSGVELEAKFQLADLVKDAPNIDLRSNYSHFWSKVDGIPGPDNRLDGQARQTANVGIDYRLKAVPLTLGGSYNWTPATYVTISATERTYASAKRQLDVYGLWKFSAATQLRIGASNLLGQDYDTSRAVSTPALLQMATSAARTFTTWSVKLEMKL